MTYFLTGFTGFIGNRLASELVKKGHQVNILVRSPGKAASLMTENVTLFQGDITDYDSVERAMKGCSGVFHLAALARVWSRNPELSYRINVEGTGNVLEAALKNGVKRVVFTSSAGTIRPSGPFEDSTEDSEPPSFYLTEYERTKNEAEKLCLEYVQKGLDVVILNPSRVYGPGMIGESNSVTKIISLYDKGKWRILPGDGSSYGNYVYIDDVVAGHVRAMEKGLAGDRYILGGENVTFEQFFRILGEVSGKKNRLIKLPAPAMTAIARVLFLIAGVFRKDPLVTPAWVERYLQHRRLSNVKAETQLGYQVTPLAEGMKKTLIWLNHNNTADEG